MQDINYSSIVNNNDPMGKAIYDYFTNNLKDKLWVHDLFGAPVEMDTAYYFRSFNAMPELEKEALSLCDGKILDVGAGAGSHSLYLQSFHLDITAIDISEYNCKVMKGRGLKNVIHQSIWNHNLNSYDTLLFLMNGIGFVGTIEKLTAFLHLLHRNCKDDVQLIFDSSSVDYLYEERSLPRDVYFGEIDCQYSYNGKFSEWFKWLYVDIETLKNIASSCNWNLKFQYKDAYGQYLVVLQKS
ncbi:MAG TPA: class I SAM-dependent methyltransferase [Chitinophagaceae bacterium]|nr:class I SAM-dependent methyltransferase [Chitinophagaceae bacterium]